MYPAAAAIIVLGILTLYTWHGWRKAARAEYIRHHVLPLGLYEKLRVKRPSLTVKQCQLVGQGLRQFFMAYLKGGCQPVAMPSQVVDELWHEFILHTKQYEHFCKRAFGQFLHHSPAAVLKSNRRSNANLRRVWWHSCREENINPRKPSRLPLLFALDAKLDIPDGFRYAVNCEKFRNTGAAAKGSVVHCGADFGSTDIDGSTEGFGDGWSADSIVEGGGSGGCSGGDGGGCGGGGCGGD